MNIAILGAGISGLAAARQLLAQGHRVQILEAHERVGGHTHTVLVQEGPLRLAIDTGFIVFNPDNYPRFSALLNELGVASQPTSMSFGVRCERTGLEYMGSDLNGLFAQRRNLANPRFLGLLADILRFHRRAAEDRTRCDDSLAVEEWVSRERLGRAFMDHYLVPLGACLWSCPADTFRRFPMRFVLDFMANHRMLQSGGRPQWRVIQGGSESYVRALMRTLGPVVRASCPVHQVRRTPAGVEVTSAAGVERYDHAVFACHADQALRLLADPDPVEQQLLTAFPYQANRVTLHTDARVLPRCRRAWASWNARVHEDGRTSASYNMNILQGLDRLGAKETYCVTLNDDDAIDPARVLSRHLYHHPVFTRERAAAQGRHGEMIGRRGLSWCGAYWGFGFHEDGVASAARVAEALGVAGAARAPVDKSPVGWAPPAPPTTNPTCVAMVGHAHPTQGACVALAGNGHPVRGNP